MPLLCPRLAMGHSANETTTANGIETQLITVMGAEGFLILESSGLN